jgi:LytS/YehU family sensor histidine kinase
MQLQPHFLFNTLHTISSLIRDGRSEAAIVPATLEAGVPTMSLQPLVENLIRHEIAQDPSAARIEVRTMARSGSLRIEVRNEGPAFFRLHVLTGWGN